MTWYVLKNEDGEIVDKKEKTGRGRPPSAAKGWERCEEDEDSAPHLENVSTAPTVAVKLAPKKKQRYYIVQRAPDGSLRRDEEGSIISKQAKRGRCPQGWERISGEELLSFLCAGQAEDSQGSELLPLEDETSLDLEEPLISHIQEMQESTAVTSAGGPNTRYFPARKKISFDNFQDLFQCEELREDVEGVTTMMLCQVIDRAEDYVEYFKLNNPIPRIDIHRESGDLRVWEDDQTSPYPDVILEGAIVD